MGFQMSVRIDEVVEDGAYPAVLDNVEEKSTKFGERLMWKFHLIEKNTEVVGFTSKSPSTRANAYRWAAAIMGEIDPTAGWGPEDVNGGRCTVVLEVAQDAQGIAKNKVVGVRPPSSVDARSGSSGTPRSGEPEDEDFDGIPF